MLGWAVDQTRCEYSLCCMLTGVLCCLSVRLLTVHPSASCVKDKEYQYDQESGTGSQGEGNMSVITTSHIFMCNQGLTD